jgi:hypothetical protein
MFGGGKGLERLRGKGGDGNGKRNVRVEGGGKEMDGFKADGDGYNFSAKTSTITCGYCKETKWKKRVMA